jgi:hypothetical protein
VALISFTRVYQSQPDNRGSVARWFSALLCPIFFGQSNITILDEFFSLQHILGLLPQVYRFVV